MIKKTTYKKTEIELINCSEPHWSHIKALITKYSEKKMRGQITKVIQRGDNKPYVEYSINNSILIKF